MVNKRQAVLRMNVVTMPEGASQESMLSAMSAGSDQQSGKPDE